MRRLIHVALLTIVCPLAAQAANPTTEVDTDRPHIGYDIGLTVPTRAPEGKAETLVIYSATWCAPCKQMGPTLANLKADGYHIVVYNVDEPETDKHKLAHPRIPAIYWIRGEEVVKHEVGTQSRRQILKTLWKPDAKPIIDQLFNRRNIDRPTLHGTNHGWLPSAAMDRSRP